jgi:hypothetical protein
VSSEPLTRDDLPGTVEPDDPLAELSDPYDLDDESEEPDGFDDQDEYGELAADDDAEELAALTALAFGDSEPMLLVWPRDEYDEIDQRWPEVLEPIGVDSWDGYRRYYQAMIARWVRRDLPPLSMVAGTAEGFAEWLVEQGADPLSVDLVAMADGYGDHLAEQGSAVELPPGEADPCWCGSEVSYRECCLPLSPR